MKKISVIVPMYYEQEVANECYTRLKNVLNSISKYENEIVFVNDGSKDRTLEILRDIASKDFGHQNAVSAGLKYATGDAVCIIDADMQDPPELIVDMVEKWEQGYEIVYGKRKVRKGESFFKLFTAKAFYRVLNMLSNVEIPKDTGDFRLIDRKVVDIINSMPENNKFLRGLFSWVGYKQYAIEYERQKRFAGKTKYPLGKMIKLSLDGIIGFSVKPLKIIGIIGVFSTLLSIILLVYSVISYIFKLGNLTSGWTSMMFAITFFSGVQLTSLWVMSEYIGRIYDEAKDRPQYIVCEKINID